MFKKKIFLKLKKKILKKKIKNYILNNEKKKKTLKFNLNKIGIKYKKIIWLNIINKCF